MSLTDDDEETKDNRTCDDETTDNAVSSPPSSSSSEKVSSLPSDRERSQAIIESFMVPEKRPSLFAPPPLPPKEDADEKSKKTTLETGRLSRETFRRRGFLRDLDLLPERKAMKLSSRQLYGDSFDDTEWSSDDDDVEQANNSDPPPPPPPSMDRMQTLTLTPTPQNKTLAGHINNYHHDAEVYDDEEQPSQIQRLLWKDEITTQRTYVLIVSMILVALGLIGGITYFLVDYI